jgi:hypothetical protein
LSPHRAVSLRRLPHASGAGPSRDITFSLTSARETAGDNSPPPSGDSSGLRRENYFQAQTFFERLSLSSYSEQRSDKLRLPL